MSGAVRLRWSTHHSTLMSMVDTFLMDESLVDVTLTCEGQTIQAHKLILSACSPYLQQLLNVKERLDPIIFLTGVKFTQLKALIQFIYQGEVNISQADLPSFLTLADELQIRGLANQGNSTESATQRIRSRILETNKRYLPHLTRFKNTETTGGLKKLLSRPPPLKRARPKEISEDEVDENSSHLPEDFQNGIAQNSDSVDSSNFIQQRDEDEAQQDEQIQNSDEEASINEVDDTDSGETKAGQVDLKVSEKQHCDWMKVLAEEDDENSGEQSSITDQYLNSWELADTDGVEIIPDEDDEDIQEIPGNSRNSIGNENEPTWCPLCNKQFQKRKTWNTHCLYDCPMVPPKYSCSNCDYRARRGYQLKIHCLKIHGIVT